MRNAIHVGNATYDYNSDNVNRYLIEDGMKSARPWLEELLDNDYRVLLYSGEMDIICAYPLTINYVKASVKTIGGARLFNTLNQLIRHRASALLNKKPDPSFLINFEPPPPQVSGTDQHFCPAIKIITQIYQSYFLFAENELDRS